MPSNPSRTELNMDAPRLPSRWRKLRAAVHSFRDVATLALLVAAPCLALAAQLSLSTSPLFLTTAATPNILFLSDDSGSMDWAMVTSESDGLMTVSPCNREYRYTHDDPGASGNEPATNSGAADRVIPTELALIAAGFSSGDLGGVWRARNSDYNKLYYNPNVRYTPWEGVDSTGALYSNMSATAARYNPYYPSNGTVDLTSTDSFTTKYCGSGGTVTATAEDFTVSNMYPAHYYAWSDVDGDGLVGTTESHTLYEIRTSGCSSGATCPSSFTRTSDRSECSVSGSTATCTVAQELQNFANWFSYYRKRDLAAKNAISKVVASNTNRMAHAAINNNSASSNISMLQMNASVSSGNKKTLLDGVFKLQPSSGTPLRTQLDAVGKYYECAAGNIFGFSASSPGSATCPIQSAASGGECQQNFTVLMTDGYWNDTFTLVSATESNADGDGDTDYDKLSYRDTHGSTLGDVAMYYYERDLATTLSDRVSVIAGGDEAQHQHMVTYTVAFGVSGTLDANPTSATQSFTWPDPEAGDAQKIDDLRHAAYNGRGEFLTAQSPDNLASTLLDTLTSISGRIGSAAAVAVNSRSLSTSTRIYQARFTSGDWSGNLRALSIDLTDGSVSAESWSAADQLKNQDWNTGRIILARNASQGIPFRWTTSGANALTATQMSYLNDNPATTPVDDDGEGSARLEWLRGNSSHEGTGNNYRVRADSFKLGDIINSTPIFVGAPLNLPDLETSPHSTFRSTYVSRRQMIYVGANDGMLHGFDASTGDEKIAFVPTEVFPSLSQLTYTAYSHRYFVDGSPTVADAYGTFSNGCSSTACWRTVLVGGLGGGGKGVFALDVTDPDGTTTSNLAFSETNASNIVLWELGSTGATASDLGYVYGQPTITKVRNGSSSYKWAAIFGNGYNSTNEKAMLYIVDITDGSVIRKIDLGNSPSNGLSTPSVVDVDGDYIADYVYAGDLLGNLWAIDLTSTNPSSWTSTYNSGSTLKPLFVAVDASNVSQAITVQPQVGDHPTGDGYMVYFGTGRYFVANDNSAATSPINTFYGIWDKLYSGSGTPVTRADLLPQTIATATVASTEVRTVTNTTIDWRTSGSTACQSDGSGKCLGWRDDLLTATTGALGEKSVSDPVLLGGSLPRVIFTTLIPQSDPCTYGGTSWLMEVSPTNGGRLDQTVFDIDGDGVVNDSDKVDGSTNVSGVNPGIGIMPQPVIIRDPANGQDLKTVTGSSGAVQTIKNYNVGAGTGSGGTTGSGRQSWRQLK